MKFDYSYIVLFGRPVFEPMVILTNVIFFLFCLFFSRELKKVKHDYALHMSRFIIFMGISGLFGAIAHAVHFQLGDLFFKTIFFISNVLNLLAVYYCFRATYSYTHLTTQSYNINFVRFISMWIIALIGLAFVQNDFVIIKINAAMVLVYALVVHYQAYKRREEKGSAIVVTGISISFFSLIVHSLKISLHEWFNYKDIAHVIMIISLIVIYKGIALNLQTIEARKEDEEEEEEEQSEDLIGNNI